MKSFAALSSLLFLGVATAQDVQSKPFNLILESTNKKYNNQQLSACHSGAAIESLCLAGNNGARFFLNTTKGETEPVKGQGLDGALVWDLPIANEPAPVSEPMSFSIVPSSNVAMPLFQPSYDVQYVTFSKDEGLLGIYSYLDDTVTPPTDQNAKVLRNWYVCETNYSGYEYWTLNWVLGDSKAKPQNPSCVKVQVKRKFV